ncbi:uncharacterized protein LOC123308475 [Coccinella septempunctata]|uniref:uncharacterized protein LOC123308475 n=1 Tax=Coccinella septempunctata TaxID=41139 RepID=UPI001D068A8B|nr:uncharacterized protein LOC123308475 [Coccinella septempunctata]
MPRCAVKDCIYNKSAICTRDRKAIHLFRFPKNEIRREQWRIALGLEKTEIYTYSSVCNLHFSKAAYDLEKSPFAVNLKKDAVPSKNVSPYCAGPLTGTAVCEEIVNNIDLPPEMKCSSELHLLVQGENKKKLAEKRN